MFESIAQHLADAVDWGNKYIWTTPEDFPWIIALLLGTGIFITFRMGWINIRYFMHAVNVIRGKYDRPEDEGDINHFQALTTALSATVGIGNIAGVAIGIHYGGPGILFWLWVSGIFGMTLKFAECTLSMHYRKFDENGNASGGPMYYIQKGLGKGWAWMGVLFACLAVICSFGTGNMNQANTVAKSAETAFGVDNWITGVVLAMLVGLVIIGGIKRIGHVSSRLMPFMALVYSATALYIIIINTDKLPAIFTEIIDGAFEPVASYGGAALGAWNFTLLWGIRRALFSNEAGQGSAPIAHAAAKTKEPVREGLVAMLGPFVDTLCICTLTGLVIIIAGVWDEKEHTTIALETKEVTAYLAPQVENLTERYVFEQIEADDERAEPVMCKLDSPAAVKEGRAEGLLFVFNDCMIIDPLILQEDNEPYTGTLDENYMGISPETGDAIELDINGGMSQTSSVLTAWAFKEEFGMIGFYIVHFSVFLFGLSTIISWSYYGERCVEFLFGVKHIMIYRLFYIGFTCLGAILALDMVWHYGDLAMGLMTVPNLIAVVLLSPVIVKLTRDYTKRMIK